jgi:hypothetical protein
VILALVCIDYLIEEFRNEKCSDDGDRMFGIAPSFDYESKRVKRLLRDSASVGWAKTASRKFV